MLGEGFSPWGTLLAPLGLCLLPDCTTGLAQGSGVQLLFLPRAVLQVGLPCGG